MRSEIILIIMGMALATFFTRFGCLVLFSRTGIPSFLQGWLQHVPTAILTALIVPGLLLPKGYLDLTIHNHYLLAGIIAAFIAYKSRNILATIGIGMAVMVTLKFLG
ncbi:MAG: branched-chain amino acid transporter [Peptococcaceae bacterium]|jgi:branched-subunit amino acid transport protein|nr:branched-chain amino acid transporter [Peptococcaceae bacterium]